MASCKKTAPTSFELRNSRRFLIERQRSTGNGEFTKLQNILDFCSEVVQEKWQAPDKTPRSPRPTGQDGSEYNRGSRQAQRRNNLTRIITELVDELEAGRDELERKSEAKSKELDDCNSSYEELNHKYGIIQGENKQLGQQINDMTERCNALLSEKKQLEQELSNMTKTIGKEIAQKTDDTRSERITGTCRPSTIAEKYDKLCFQEASHVKDNLHMPEKLPSDIWDMFKKKFICAVFQESWHILKTSYENLINHLLQCLEQPIQELCVNSDTGYMEIKKTATISVELMEEIHSHLLTSADGVCVDTTTESVLEAALGSVTSELCFELDRNRIDPTVLSEASDAVRGCTNVISLVRSACKLSWQMVIQNPMMLLVTDGVDKPHNPETQTAVMGVKSTNWRVFEQFRNNPMVVHYYIEPTLVHGGKVSMKGRVALRQGSKEK